MKLFELARELGVPGKELLAKVQKFGIVAKDTFTELSPEQIKKIKQGVNEPSSVTSPIRIKATEPGVAKAAGARKVRRKIDPEKLAAEARAAEEAAKKAEEEAKAAEEAAKKAEEEAKAAEAAKIAAELAAKEEAEKAAAAAKIAAAPTKETEDHKAKKAIKDKKPEPIVPEEDPSKKKHVKKAGHDRKPKELDVKESLAEAVEVNPNIQTYSATSFSGKHRYNKWNKPGRGTKHKKDKKPHLFNARKKDLIIGETIFVGELASLIGIKAGQIIKTLMNLGIMVTVNESIDAETAQLVAAEYEVEVRVEIKSVEDTLDIAADKSEDMIVKAPVVTIMGHVDHGKTSLLDKIRSANVTDGEAGGITQHIGAYNVTLPDGSKICFLDTPGHEAFTAMRARGASATDIVILVVAADDGPRPQTIEAINHSKAAGVPLIVAINKCDKPGATPDKVVQQLMEHELVAESFGGDIPMIEVSAHSGLGIDKLLEAIHLQAEIMELTANPTRTAEGVVIESRLDKGRGNVCTILIQNGTLKIGDSYVVGQEFGRVRALWDDKGNSLKIAPPSTPVEVVGLNGLPFAGDVFQVGVDEKTVRQIAEARTSKAKVQELASREVFTLENIFERASEAEKTNLNLIIKADVVGSMEALSASLQKLGNDEVSVKVIHSAVGGISQTDVALAHASQAIVIGFNVRPDGQAKKNAKNDNVEIKLYSIIYECIEDVTKALEGLLQPIVREEFQGKAEVLEVFTIPKIGVIAGTKIVEGKFMRDSPVRVFRDNVLIYEGQLASLQRFKDSVKEVATGFECGIGIQSYKDLKAGDTLESYQRTETAAKL